MRLPSACALAACLAISFLLSGEFARSGAGSKEKEPPAKDEAKPKLRLKLTADPQVGFTPLTTTLTAILSGVAPHDPNFCHPATTWLRVNPGQLEENASRYSEDSACRHPDSEIETTTTFTKTFDLYRPGPYLFRLIVEGKDHRRIESAYMRVEVLRVQ